MIEKGRGGNYRALLLSQGCRFPSFSRWAGLISAGLPGRSAQRRFCLGRIRRNSVQIQRLRGLVGLTEDLCFRRLQI
jgi:hypothetical protein